MSKKTKTEMQLYWSLVHKGPTIVLSEFKRDGTREKHIEHKLSKTELKSLARWAVQHVCES